MVCGPIYVLLCSIMIMQSVRDNYRPHLSVESSDKNDYFSTEERKRGESFLSLVSIDFDDGELVRNHSLSHNQHQHQSQFNHNLSNHSSEPSLLPKIESAYQLNQSLLQNTNLQNNENNGGNNGNNSNNMSSNHSNNTSNNTNNNLHEGQTTNSIINRSKNSPSSFCNFGKFSCNYFLVSLKSYRRIIFLIVASIISIISALVIANTAWKIDKYTEQTSFYNCMLRNNAYEEINDTDICGGKAKRLRVSWSIFTVEIFLVSFGIGPFLAFGTETVRMSIKRFFKWLGFIIKFYCTKCSQKIYNCFQSTSRSLFNSNYYNDNNDHILNQNIDVNIDRASEYHRYNLRDSNLSNPAQNIFEPRISQLNNNSTNNNNNNNNNINYPYSGSISGSISAPNSAPSPNNTAPNRFRTTSYRSSETDESSIIITPFYEGQNEQTLNSPNQPQPSQLNPTPNTTTSNTNPIKNVFGVQKRSFFGQPNTTNDRSSE